MRIKTLRPTFRAKKHLVSSVHYLASMAGLRILEAGGNAADAGVATGLCLNVLETELTHFGGIDVCRNSPPFLSKNRTSIR